MNFHPLPESGERVTVHLRSLVYPLPVIWDMHQAFEIAVVVSGGYDRHFGGPVLHLGPGDVVLSPPWEPHGLQSTTVDTVVLSVWFPPEFLGDDALGAVPWLSFFGAAPGDRPRVRDEQMRQEVLAIAAEMGREIQQKDEEWLVGIRLGVCRLLFTIGRKWAIPAAARNRPPIRLGDLARVAPAVSLVHARLGRPVSVDEGAKACCLSPSRFGVLFRHHMGLSFGRYVLRSRLMYVARLLLTGEDSLDTIAEELDFADRSHLHHAFAKQYGCTPGQYRERRLFLQR